MIRKFILSFLACCACLMALLLPVELLLRRVPNNYSYKNDYLERHARQIRTLILGSSHSYLGLDPRYLPPGAFNAAYVSQSLNYDYAILNKFRDRLDSLQLLIVPVSYASLFQTVDEGLESWRLKHYDIYYNISFSGNILHKAELLHIQKPVWQTLYRYYVNGQDRVTCSKGGSALEHHAADFSDTALAASGRLAAERHTAKNLSRLPEIRSYLDRMLLIARDKHCRVVLFTPPGHPAYRAHLDPEQMVKTRETIRDMLDKNEHVVYHDFLADPDFADADYYDADHLNMAGSVKLSRKMATLISSMQE